MKHKPLIRTRAILLGWFIVSLALPSSAWSVTTVEGTNGTSGTKGAPLIDATTNKTFCSQAARGAVVNLPGGSVITLNACSTSTVVATDICGTSPTAGNPLCLDSVTKVDVSVLPTSVQTGSGTTGYFPVWASANQLVVSEMYQSGSSIVRARSGVNIMVLEAYSTPGNNGASFSARRSHSDTLGAKATTLDGDLLGAFGFSGVGSTAAGFTQGPFIQAIQVGSAGTSLIPAKLRFVTSSASAQNLTQLVLNPDNSVAMSGPVSAANIVQTPTALYIPQAGTDHKIDIGWLPCTATPTAGACPLADGSGKLAAGWIPSLTSSGTGTGTGSNNFLPKWVTYTQTSTATSTATYTVTMTALGNSIAYDNGNMGINKTNPATTLDVGGNVSANNITATPGSDKIVKSRTTPATIDPAWLPEDRTVCGHGLNADVVCTAADVGALAGSGTTGYHSKWSSGGLIDSTAYDDGSVTTFASASYANTPVTASVGLPGLKLVAPSLSTTDAIGITAMFANPVGISSGLVFGRYGSTWGTFVAINAHPDNAVALDGYSEVARFNVAGMLLNGALKLNGSTSGTVTHDAAATTASYTLRDPSTAPGAGQAIVYPSGGGQGTWATPLAGNGYTVSSAKLVDGATNGQITSARAMTSGDVTTALGYTPGVGGLLKPTVPPYMCGAGMVLTSQATPGATECIEVPNRALSNLSSVAFNASLIPDAHVTRDVGSPSKNINDIYTNRIKVNGAFATATPTANAPVVADSSSSVNDWVKGTSGSVAVFGVGHIGNGAPYAASPTANSFPISDGSGTLNGWVKKPILSGSITTSNVSSTNGSVVALVPSVTVDVGTYALITLTASGYANASTQCRIGITVDGSRVSHGSALINTTASDWSMAVTIPVSLSAGSHSFAAVLDQLTTPGDTCSVLASTYPDAHHASLTITGAKQ